MRDALADKQSYNKNMQFILSKEEALSEQKSELESEALRSLSGDLALQLKEMGAHSEKVGGKVTMQLMQAQLDAQLHKTVDGYDRFVGQAEKDLLQTQSELGKYTQILQKEQGVTRALEAEKQLN